MKKIHDNIRWLVAVALLWLALPAKCEVRDTVTFDFSGLVLEDVTAGGETFLLPSLPDCDVIDQTGAPMLPVKYVRLSVPYNATNISVSSSASGSSTVLSQRIYPAPVPIATDDSVTGQPDMVIDSAIYMTSSFWPPEAVELVGDGFYMGDNHIVTVAVYPTRYNPVTSRLRKMSTVRFAVNYDLGDTPANMLVRRGGDLRHQEQLSVKAMVDNPGQVETFAMQPAQIQHLPVYGLLPDSAQTDTTSNYYGGDQEIWGDRARYLIVTTRELAPAFKRLAALKRQKGYSVQIKCIEDILADPRVQQGDRCKVEGGGYSCINDDAGKLRQYLKLAHAFDNTQFVLMGGKDVPYRNHISIKRDKQMHEIGLDSIPTDWYYADLTSLLNKKVNHNPEFYYYTDLDGHELLVGRLMAETKEQIDNYTDKLLRYELNPGHGDASYLSKCLVVQGAELNPKINTANIMSMAYSGIFPDTTVIRQYGHDYPTGGDVISNINATQYGLLSIHGHGCPFSTTVNDWNISYSNQDSLVALRHKSYQRISSLDEYFTDLGNGLDCLTNKYNPGVYYSWSCENAPFDNPQRSFYRKYDCNMAQSYILGKDYGGIAFLGNTRDGFYSPAINEETLNNSPKIEKNFAQLLAGGVHRLSEAESLSKEIYYSSPLATYRRHLLLTHNLHGDPELQVWSGAPLAFGNISVTRNANSINVSGFAQQDSVVVALLSNYTAQQMIPTNGQVIFSDINPNSTVMVYRHNYLPYIAPLYLQNERIERSQYVIANDIYAGKAVDPNRSTGDLTIESGVEFELDAKGKVVLAPGFKVEKGALFSVTQSDY